MSILLGGLRYGSMDALYMYVRGSFEKISGFLK